MTHTFANEPLELWDALKEVNNIGCGQALSRLARLSRGSRWMLELPTLSTHVPASEVWESVAFGVALGVCGRARGTFVMLMERADAVALVRDVAGRSTAETIGPLETSALLELGNIVSSAFLDALSEMTGETLLPTPPKLQEGRLDELWRSYAAGYGVPVVIATSFFEKAGRGRGSFLFIVDRASARDLGETLGVVVHA